MKRRVLFLIMIAMVQFGWAARIDSVSIQSASMNKAVKVIIITPDSYQKKKDKNRYPVVYMLHGYSGNHRQWVNDAPAVASQADRENLILVCPDGGFGSWYFDSPVDSSIRYETFISKELVAYIDGNYRTVTDRDKRAITGLSMGGHGALYLAIRHPETFGQAGSICGGVDFRPFPDKWDLQKALGDTSCCRENWENNTVINLVNQIEPGKIKLVIDCGVDDFFIEVNRNLHKKLLELKIPHDYTERPGAHNKDYWSNSILHHLFYFSKNWK